MFTALGSIKISDFWRGLIVAVATVLPTIILESVGRGSLTFNWKMIVLAALSGGLGYILKNLGTGVNGNLLTNK